MSGVGVPSYSSGANNVAPLTRDGGVTALGNNAGQFTSTNGAPPAPSGPTSGGNNNLSDPFAISQPTPPSLSGINLANTVVPGLYGQMQSFAVAQPLPGTHGISGGPESYRMGGWGAGAPPNETPREYEAVSFAAGGMMSAQGQAIRPGAGMIPTDEPQMGASAQTPMTPQQIEQEAQRLVQMHPDIIEKVKMMLMQGMQSGELNPNELNLAVQLAKATLANPASYPQVRQFAIQNGLGTEADIPQQIDQGLLLALIVAGKAMQTNMPTSGATQTNVAPKPQAGGIMPEYSDGGMTGDRPHIAKLHAREYVIPEDTLLYHGKKHFDKLIEQARTPPDAGN